MPYHNLCLIMGCNSFPFNRLKRQVLEVAGLKDIYPAECGALSVQISKATGTCLNEITLKRIYGFARANFEASAYTKDVLAQFCGYDSWEGYTIYTKVSSLTAQNYYENMLPIPQIAHLQTFFDGIPSRVLLLKAVYDESGQIRDFEIELVNQATEAITGRTDLPGKLCNEEFPGIKQAGLYQLMIQVMQTGQPRQLEYYYPHEGFEDRYCSLFIKTAEGLLTIHCDSPATSSQ